MTIFLCFLNLNLEGVADVVLRAVPVEDSFVPDCASSYDGINDETLYL